MVVQNDKRKKRSNQDGHISKRKDGLWTARIQLGQKQNGSPNVKAFYGKSRQEVKKKLDDYKKIFFTRGVSDAKKITVAQYFHDWLTLYKIKSLKEASFDRLETTVNTHIIPGLGSIQLGNISPNSIQALINDKSEKKSYSTVKKIYDALNACFKHAVNMDDLYKNPMGLILMPNKDKFAIQKKTINILTNEDIKQFVLEATRKHKTGAYMYINGLALVLALNTGLRVGELIGLNINSIDLNNNTITVRRNLILVKDRAANKKSNYTTIEQSTKTESGKRVIPLNRTARKMVELLISVNRKYRTKLNYLLVSRNGTPILLRSLQNTFDSILRRCGIDHCGIHTLRHTFASKLLEQGVDIKTVSELLGHSSIKITYDTYIHILQKTKSNAVRINELNETME